MRTKIVKMSVNLPSDAVDVLQRLAKKHGTTVTAQLRRAIDTAKFIDDALDDGGKVLVEHESGKMSQLVFR